MSDNKQMKNSDLSTSNEVDNSNAGEWFVVQVLSGHESRVKNSILKSLAKEVDELPIFEILVPEEDVTEVRHGKRTVRTKKCFPGYMLMRMNLYSTGKQIDSEVWHFLNSVTGVIGFLGGERPAPLSKKELKDIMSQVTGDDEAPKPKIEFELGETLNIKEGAFASFEGVVESIDPARGKIKLMVSIFGRPTPVELEYWQVERQ